MTDLTPVTKLESMKDYEGIARRWYELVNALAPDYLDGADLIEDIPWSEFPASNQALLVAVVTNLIAEGTIR